MVKDFHGGFTPMAHEYTNLLLLTTVLLLLTTTVTSDDAAVMSSFLTTLTSPPSSWKTGTDYCSWEDIQCDNSKRVTCINLATKSLSGSLPTNLNELTELKTLALQRNSLTGELPSLANLTNLEQVFLDENNFTSISKGFFLGLTNLQRFSIYDNLDLSPWSIPSDITDSSILQSFEASNAGITGSIPDFFGSFPNLQSRLRLSYNDLTRSLPSTFGGSQIHNLWLNNQKTGLYGSLEVLAFMTELSQVWLQANSFTRAIPDLSKCESLFVWICYFGVP